MSEEKKVKDETPVTPVSDQTQPLTKDQQIANVFNQCLQLVVREIQLAYSSVNAILSSK